MWKKGLNTVGGFVRTSREALYNRGMIRLWWIGMIEPIAVTAAALS
jgi:hypothetical protein